MIILLGRILQLPRGKGHKRTKVLFEGAPPPPPPPPPSIRIRKTATAPGSPYSFRIVRGFFYVPQNYQHSRNCEMAYRPYPRRLESLTITKTALSPQLFKDHECWSGRSLELTTSRVSARCSAKWAPVQPVKIDREKFIMFAMEKGRLKIVIGLWTMDDGIAAILVIFTWYRDDSMILGVHKRSAQAK